MSKQLRKLLKYLMTAGRIGKRNAIRRRNCSTSCSPFKKMYFEGNLTKLVQIPKILQKFSHSIHLTIRSVLQIYLDTRGLNPGTNLGTSRVTHEVYPRSTFHVLRPTSCRPIPKILAPPLLAAHR